VPQTLVQMMAHRDGVVVTSKEGDLTSLLRLGADQIPNSELHPEIASVSDRRVLGDSGHDPAPPERTFFARCAARIREFARARRPQ
jgi:hypothetical protein